jgi:hypothetical protein
MPVQVCFESDGEMTFIMMCGLVYYLIVVNDLPKKYSFTMLLMAIFPTK